MARWPGSCRFRLLNSLLYSPVLGPIIVVRERLRQPLALLSAAMLCLCVMLCGLMLMTRLRPRCLVALCDPTVIPVWVSLSIATLIMATRAVRVSLGTLLSLCYRLVLMTIVLPIRVSVWTYVRTL